MNKLNSSAGRRMVVNGKLLTYKQTAQFEKFMAESDTFRTNYLRLASESNVR